MYDVLQVVERREDYAGVGFLLLPQRRIFLLDVARLGHNTVAPCRRATVAIDCFSAGARFLRSKQCPVSHLWWWGPFAFLLRSLLARAIACSFLKDLPAVRLSSQFTQIPLKSPSSRLPPSFFVSPWFLPVSLGAPAAHAAGSMNKEGGIGGKGESGMGVYRGKSSFESFTHRKVVAIQSPNFDPLAKYPPYDVSENDMLCRLMSVAAKPRPRSAHQRSRQTNV